MVIIKKKEAAGMPDKTVFQKRIAEENEHIMPVSEVIDKVAA